MADRIVGMMFAYNEGDILAQTIEAALPHVDSLFIADDGSQDQSWDIIQCMARAHKDKIEHIRQHPDPKDKGQRSALLAKIKKRYDPTTTWVQVIEADVMILDTDIRQAIKRFAVNDVALTWTMLNAVRYPGKTWKEVDSYPHWGKPLTEIMPRAHFMEYLLYTFRPMPKLYFDPNRWRPYPRGFSRYIDGPVKIGTKSAFAPLLLHIGYRGPTHFYEKFKNHGSNINGKHSKYRSWDLSSPDTVLNTVSFFNDTWNNCAFPATRAGWASRKDHEDQTDTTRDSIR